MRVSPPSESFGILHIYVVSKVSHIFTDLIGHALELQPALNLAAAMKPNALWGEGAGRTVSS